MIAVDSSVLIDLLGDDDPLVPQAVVSSAPLALNLLDQVTVLPSPAAATVKVDT